MTASSACQYMPEASTARALLFAEHLTAEYRVRTKGRGRTVDEWKLPAHKPDTTGCEQSEQTGRESAGRVRRMRPRSGTQPLALDRCVKGWFDCVVGCAAAASIQGVERVGAAVQAGAKERKRIRLSEIQRAKR